MDAEEEVGMGFLKDTSWCGVRTEVRSACVYTPRAPPALTCVGNVHSSGDELLSFLVSESVAFSQHT